MGWVGTVSVPQILLQRALQSHPEMTVSMRYQLDGSDAEFSSGDVPNDAETATIDLQQRVDGHDVRPSRQRGASSKAARSCCCCRESR